MVSLRSISLFCGCGGLDFGARRAGIDVVFANDVLTYATDTFKRYFPEADVRAEDIKTIQSFPKVDLITGGYPCQSFSMGGNRRPESDPRTTLFREFARAVDSVSPKYFLAENVSGLKSVDQGRWLSLQLNTFKDLGKYGYRVSHALLNAQEYGVPQRRRRIFIIGVRSDLNEEYVFPPASHGEATGVPFRSHGNAILHLPLEAKGEYYERESDPGGNFSWYYLSRNRKAPWHSPSFTIVANFRHITLHPASPSMNLISSNLADGFKQTWGFTKSHEHTVIDESLPTLERPRRLSWREAAAIQTFPNGFEPSGTLQQKFLQVGNAVPPALIEVLLRGITEGTCLRPIVSISTKQTAEKRAPVNSLVGIDQP